MAPGRDVLGARARRRRHRLGRVHEERPRKRLHAGDPRQPQGSQLPHVDTFHRDNLLSRGQEIAVEVDEKQAVDLLLTPGEFSLHHIKLVHGSAPNRSADRRIGYALRYIPTHVRQTKVRDSAMLVRGVDTYHHFDPEPRPRHDLDEAALAAHAEAVNRQVAALYQGTDKKEFRA